ncbi:MAG: hypothetical protein PSX37_01580, partial [bacterium]|nr:hypothetical protein [bacterium]
SRSTALNPKGEVQAFVTVIVPRVDGESVPVTIDPNGVTITRNGTTVTTGLPVAGPIHVNPYSSAVALESSAKLILDGLHALFAGN